MYHSIGSHGTTREAITDHESAPTASTLTVPLRIPRPGGTFSVTDSALGRSTYTGTTAVGTEVCESCHSLSLHTEAVLQGRSTS